MMKAERPDLWRVGEAAPVARAKGGAIDRTAERGRRHYSIRNDALLRRTRPNRSAILGRFPREIDKMTTKITVSGLPTYDAEARRLWSTPANFLNSLNPSGAEYVANLERLAQELLRELERRYGSRDSRYYLERIVFGAEGSPCVDATKHGAVIYLSAAAKTSAAAAVFELAHEVVHLLAPTGGFDSTVLEEGLATMFQHEIMGRCGMPNFRSSVRAYLEAEGLLKQLIQLDVDVVAKLRKREPDFSKWTAEDIQTFVPGASRQIAEALCEPFRTFMPRHS